jgi:hypothetical protein
MAKKKEYAVVFGSQSEEEGNRAIETIINYGTRACDDFENRKNISNKEKRKIRLQIASAILRLNKILRLVNQGSVEISPKNLNMASQKIKEWQIQSKKITITRDVGNHPWHKGVSYVSASKRPS